MTSNAYKKNNVGFKNTNTNITEEFSDEFLGRFDDFIYFNSLTKMEALTYLKENIKENINYEELLNNNDYEKYGFRSLNKIINKYKSKINN